MTTELPPEVAAEVDLDEIIRELNVDWDTLPEEAIREAQQHREAITPKLIEAIRNATEQARDGNTPEGNLHFFALFLLAEFEAKEALPRCCA